MYGLSFSLRLVAIWSQSLKVHRQRDSTGSSVDCLQGTVSQKVIRRVKEISIKELLQNLLLNPNEGPPLI